MRISLFAVGAIWSLAAPVLAQNASLPEGRLTLFAGNNQAANFIIEDSIRREGDQVKVATFRVYADEIPVTGGSIAYDTTRMVIDCSARTVSQVAVDAFLASGRRVTGLGPEPAMPIRANETWDFVARVVCDGVRFGPEATVVGYQAARTLALARIRP